MPRGHSRVSTEEARKNREEAAEGFRSQDHWQPGANRMAKETSVPNL